MEIAVFSALGLGFGFLCIRLGFRVSGRVGGRGSVPCCCLCAQAAIAPTAAAATCCCCYLLLLLLLLLLPAAAAAAAAAAFAAAVLLCTVQSETHRSQQFCAPCTEMWHLKVLYSRAPSELSLSYSQHWELQKENAD